MKKIWKVIIIIGLIIFFAGLAVFTLVNRNAFLDQIGFNEERNIQKYEKMKKEREREPNRIEIPSLGVIAKITEPKDKIEMEKLLLESVTYNLGSALPGDNGNVVITGHSSAPSESEYSHVFATLNKLEFGDKIIIYKDSVMYNYEVRVKDFVNEDEVSVLSNEKSGLTLITCWPIGTDYRRLIIFAEMS